MGQNNYFRITAFNRFHAVVVFLRKELGWKSGDALVSRMQRGRGRGLRAREREREREREAEVKERESGRDVRLLAPREHGTPWPRGLKAGPLLQWCGR